MSDADDRQEAVLRTSVLLARSREARARATRVLERGLELRGRCRDLHEDVSYLRARSSRLTRPHASADLSAEE